jgi:hypothetical protein
MSPRRIAVPLFCLASLSLQKKYSSVSFECERKRPSRIAAICNAHMVLPFTRPPVSHKELEVACSQEMKLGSPSIHSQVFGTIFPFSTTRRLPSMLGEVGTARLSWIRWDGSNGDRAMIDRNLSAMISRAKCNVRIRRRHCCKKVV